MSVSTFFHSFTAYATSVRDTILNLKQGEGEGQGEGNGAQSIKAFDAIRDAEERHSAELANLEEGLKSLVNPVRWIVGGDWIR